MFRTLLISALATVAVAYCPNGCSGHGSCGVNDKCNCYNRPNGDVAWTGADCSMRTCPKGAAWVDTVVSSNDLHPNVECSAKGICDRAGLCLTESQLRSRGFSNLLKCLGCREACWL